MFNNENGLMRRRCYPDLRSVLMIACLFLWAGTASAQDQQEISGTVTDASNGEPLPGANITVVDQPIGTSTNVDGEYSLEVPADVEMLRVSFIGYETQEVAIEGRSTINFALAPSEAQLDELVVIGYGTQEERDVTGVVQEVDASEFNTGSLSSPEGLISGKVPGLQISSSDGAPGANFFVRLRGATSVNANSEPLFVIDGVPIDNAGNRATRNPLNFLNPGDIANITVLKDASATAIYGSRGANGVILIETRSAEGDEGRVSYNGSASSATVTQQIDMLDAQTFRDVVAERAPDQLNRLGYTSTDWQDVVQRTAFTQEHNLSFSRGYDDSSILVSLGYLDQEGTIETSALERVSASVKYDQNFFDDQLTLQTSVRGSKSSSSFEPGVLGAAADFAPTQPIRDVNSPYGGFFEWSPNLAEKNPVATYLLSRGSGESYRSLGNIEAEYRLPFVDGLSFRTVLGYDVQEGEQEFFQPTNLKAQADREDEAGIVERRNFSRLNTLLDAYLTYDRMFEEYDSDINFTAGYSWQAFHSEFPEFTASGLSNNILRENSTAPVTSQENSSTFVTEVPNRLISGFGRLNYKLKNRYLLTATVRRDGSSRFGPANQWGTFPSVALGWRVDEESFMEDIDFLSSLKLRGSWGVTGNQDIGDFLYASLYTLGTSDVQAQFGDEFVGTIRPSAADESLQWEETTTYNVGVDYGFLDGRLTGSVEYYLKQTDELIFSETVPRGVNLSDVVVTNIGSMENRGVELAISAVVVERDDFSYNAQFNASTNNNEITNVTRDILTGGIAGGTGDQVQIIREGEPINSFYLYEHKYEDGQVLTDGVDHNGDGATNDLDMYVDQNSDGVINSDDRIVSESPQPDWIFGHTSQMRYRNFDFSFTVRAQLGNYVYNNVASQRGLYDRLINFAPSNLHESVLETNFQERQVFSDYYLEDASFIRMDNISLGYTLPELPGIERLRIYGTVQNPFVITGYSGPDPEVPSGIDNTLYPRSRTFTAGVNLQL